jgi:hypothetical protein
MKTVAIHQPNFLPWCGYFYKMAKADIFVLLDDVLHSKQSYTNRVNIKTPNGKKRLSVPLAKKEILIKDIPIFNDGKWNHQQIKLIHDSYSRASYFKGYFEVFENIFTDQWDYLADFNIKNIISIKELLGINTEIIRSSELEIDNVDKNKRNMMIVKELDGDIYLSGDGGGRQYNIEELFHKEGLEVQYTNFTHPFYNQLWGEFEYGLSIIDLLFNEGPQSMKVLLGND